MTKNTPALLCTLILTAFTLQGCSGVKNSLGLTKSSPDEFSVITRAPLELPQTFTLPPPNPGASRPQEQSTIQQAEETVLGHTQDNAQSSSSAENALLQKAGTQDNDANIRAIVNKETEDLNDRNVPIGKKILNLATSNDTSSASVVDAKKELERLQKNKADGKSITEGETPILEQ